MEGVAAIRNVVLGKEQRAKKRREENTRLKKKKKKRKKDEGPTNRLTVLHLTRKEERKTIAGK